MISNCEIYEFSGIYHLILEKAQSSSREMFWCSVSGKQNMAELIQASDIGMVTPRAEWQLVGKISDDDYQKAIGNFHAQMNEELNLDSKSDGISR